jgi:PhnB protein
MTTDNIPTVSLSLTFKGGLEALEFYKKAFGAEELYRMEEPKGVLAHGEIKVGNTHIYLSDESAEWHAFALPEGAMASCLFSIVTDDCDASYAQAVGAGAVSLKEPKDEFWGARAAMVKDPWGYRWSFGQLIEEVPVEEIENRVKEMDG